MKFKNFIIAFIFCLSLPIKAFSQISSAESFIENFSNNLFTIVKNEEISNQKKSQLLVHEIENSIDANYICKFVIGRDWRKASKKFQTNFCDLYKTFLIQTYSPQFKGYNGETYKIIKTEEMRKNRFKSIINLITNDNSIIEVTIYFIFNRDNQYKIVDVTAEGISFIATQRTELKSIIENQGFDSLLEILEEKVENLKQ
ncbi:MAG: ABC transporter substrate-binding protein [Rickettsiales bacterium]|nr:ABC transporter substrate-binding protein [Rickettsiales bacterium]